MAKAFNLTAEINLRGPANLRPTINKIKSAFSSLKADVKVNIDASTAKDITAVSTKLDILSKAATRANTSISTLNKSLSTLSTSFTDISASISTAFGAINAGSKQLANSKKQVAEISSEIEYFGQQSGQAIRRFAAFSTVTAVIYGLNNAINSAFGEFITFNKEVVKLSQVTGKSIGDLSALTDEITRLSTGLGVSSTELISVASTLAQAGFNATDTKAALEALAKSSLAPSFENIADTTEGAIAILRQFGLEAQDLESALGSINAVAAAFAVESQDLVAAIQRTGGVFANSSKGVSEGTDALNEFLAIFTSIRATTRESAETIATGLRTIFTRLQRSRTIDLLKELGINLTDLEGKFVGPYKAVEQLSKGLSQLDPRDIRFSQIVEELGGFRQIGKVIPLIQQFATAEQALGVAQSGQTSLTQDSITAQLSFANQLSKTRESFLALIREVGDSTTFKAFIQGSIILTDSLISLTRAVEPLLPLLATLGTVKLASLGSQFLSGFLGAGGLRPNLPQKNNGGRILKFATGGMVPGSGNTDSVRAMLQPGEFVLRKKAVDSIGSGVLHNVNKYGIGGTASGLIQKFMEGGIVRRNNDTYLESDVVRAMRELTGLQLTDQQALEEFMKKNEDGHFYYSDFGHPKNSKKLPKWFGSYRPQSSGALEAVQAATMARQDKMAESRQKRGLTSFEYEGRSSEEKNFLKSRGYAFGGHVQKFAGGKQVRKLDPSAYEQSISNLQNNPNSIINQPSVGVAILKGPKTPIVDGSVSKATIVKSISGKYSKILNSALKGQIKIEKEALGPDVYQVFNQGIESGLVQAVNTAISVLGEKYPSLPSPAISDADKQKYLKGVNDAAKGNLFEEILTSMKNKGIYDEDQDPQRPFDFVGGLGDAGSLFKKISNLMFVDAKASDPANENIAKKIANQTIRDLGVIKVRSGAPADSVNIENAIKDKLSQLSNGSSISLKQLQGDIPDTRFATANTIAKQLGLSVARSRGVVSFNKKAMGGYIEKFANGGSSQNMVPALLTPGEAVIGPRLAKSIGLSKLNSMNHADKNQNSKFASGGDVSIVPGTGNSDTFGPVPLPIGSYVIRKKATQALGFNRGGSVRRFAAGGSTGSPVPATTINNELEKQTNSIIDNLGGMNGAILAFTSIVRPQLEKFASTLVDVNSAAGRAVSEGIQGASALGLSSGIALQAAGASKGIVTTGQVAGTAFGGISGAISGFSTKKLEENITNIDSSFKKFDKALKDVTEATTATLRIEAASKLDAEFTKLLGNITKYNKEIQDTSNLKAFGTLVDNTGQSLLTFGTILITATQAQAASKAATAASAAAGIASTAGLLSRFGALIPVAGQVIAVLGGVATVGYSIYSYFNTISKVSGDVIKNFERLADVTANQVKTGNDFSTNNKKYAETVSQASQILRETSGPGQEQDRQTAFGTIITQTGDINELNLLFNQIYKSTLRQNGLFIRFDQSINEFISGLSDDRKATVKRLETEAIKQFEQQALSKQIKISSPGLNEQQIADRVNKLMNAAKGTEDFSIKDRLIKEFSTTFSVTKFSTDALAMSQKALATENYNLIDVLSRFDSILSASTYKLNSSFDNLNAYVDDLTGQGRVRTDTTAKDLANNLKNITAISSQDLIDTLDQTFKLIPMDGKIADSMRASIIGAQAIQKELPILIRTARSSGGFSDATSRNALEQDLKKVLAPAFAKLPQENIDGTIPSGMSRTEIENNIIREVADKIAETGADKTLSIEELLARLGSELPKILEMVGSPKAMETLQKALSEDVNNKLEKLAQTAQRTAEVLQKINQLEIKRSNLLTQTDIDIARATSQPVSLQQLNESFNNTINRLTRGIGVNPELIGRRLEEAIKQASTQSLKTPDQASAAALIRSEIMDLQSALQIIGDSNDRLKNSIDNLTKVNQQMVQEGDLFESINRALATGNFAEFAKLSQLPAIFQKVMANPANATPKEIMDALEYVSKAPMSAEQRQTTRNTLMEQVLSQGSLQALNEGDITNAMTQALAAARFILDPSSLQKLAEQFNIDLETFSPNVTSQARENLGRQVNPEIVKNFLLVLKELAVGVKAKETAKTEAQIAADAIKASKDLLEKAQISLTALTDPLTQTLDKTTNIWSTFNNNITGVLDRITTEFDSVAQKFAIKKENISIGDLPLSSKVKPPIETMINQLPAYIRNNLETTGLQIPNNIPAAQSYLTRLINELEQTAQAQQTKESSVLATSSGFGASGPTRPSVNTQKDLNDAVQRARNLYKELSDLDAASNAPTNSTLPPPPPPSAPPPPPEITTPTGVTSIPTAMNTNLFEFLDKFKTTFGSNIDRFDTSILNLGQTFGLLNAPINQFTTSVNTLLSGLNEFNSKGGIKGPSIPEKATINITFDENLIVEAVGGNNVKLLEQVGQITKQQIDTALKSAFRFQQ